jgi:hypothetical protein
VLAQKTKTEEKNAKEMRKKVIEDAMLECREERLSLVGTRLSKTASGINKNS